MYLGYPFIDNGMTEIFIDRIKSLMHAMLSFQQIGLLGNGHILLTIDELLIHIFKKSCCSYFKQAVMTCVHV